MSRLSDSWRARAEAASTLGMDATANAITRCADELDASGMIEPPAPRKQAGSVCKACFGVMDQWRWDAAKKKHIAVPCDACGASKETEREIK